MSQTTTNGIGNGNGTGEWLRVPLVDPRLASVTTFTFSAAATEFQFTRASFDPTGSSITTYTPLVPNTDQTLTNLDTAMLLHEGVRADFDQQYLLKPPSSGVIDQIAISAGFALDVSTYVDGAALLTYLKVTLQPFYGTAAAITGPVEVFLKPSVAFTALSAAGTHMYIVRHVYDVPFDVYSDGPLIVRIQIGKSGTSVNDTYQLGLLDMYPINKSTATKRLFPSELLVHIRPKQPGVKSSG